MKLIGKRGLSGVLEIVVWVLIAAAVAAIVTLPWIVDLMMDLNVRDAKWDVSFWRPRYMVTLGVSGVMALLMLWQARHVMHGVNTGTVFTMRTVRCIKILGAEALLTSLFYVVMLFCGMTKFAVGLVALVFALLGMMALVFSEVFRQATLYKQENDMTI